jgi:sulfate permease, SulP family
MRKKPHKRERGKNPHFSSLSFLLPKTFPGLALVAFGALKAASFVQYLPLPCVGGYLAFVGFFVSLAGLNLSVDTDFATVAGWKTVLHSPTRLAQLAACLGCTGMFLLVLRRCRHPAALPAAIAAVPAAFYLILMATGSSLADAARAGWTLPAAPAKPWWSVYELFDPEGDGFLRGLVVSAGVSQIPKFVVLFAVVAFGR